MTARPYLRTHDLVQAGLIVATAGPEHQRSGKRFIVATFLQRLRQSTSVRPSRRRKSEIFNE